MLLIKTNLDKSSIHGIGLFADEFIAAETVIWKFCDVIDLCFDECRLKEISENAAGQIRKYSYRDKLSDLYILCGDDARFFNHSNEPNCFDFYDYKDLGSVTIAARDIRAGEELTCNYAMFDQDFLDGRYVIPASTITIPRAESGFKDGRFL